VPLFEQHVSVMVRSVRAFLNLQAGVTRSSEAPPPSWLSQASENGELEAVRRELESKDRELRELQARPAENGTGTEASLQAGSLGLASVTAGGSGAQKPVLTEQLIWMFGHSRTGSSWLSWMMAELENQERWHEPYVGMLFGSFLFQKLKDNHMVLNSPTFIMAEPYREVWLRSIRNFILEGAAVRFPELREDQYLVVKEPNGSIGAPLLMEATPGSRMIFLIRDPRDVIASRLEAFGQSGWAHQKRDYSTAEKLIEHTEQLATDYLRVLSKVQEAYEAHPGKKVLVRYENLRHDTVDVLKEMYDVLEIEVDETQVEAAATKHSWEQIPESEKGKDKFFRKAQPGSWKDDLSPEQIKLIEDITGPILSKYY
jgi:Sulfotransferase domain